MERFLNLFRSFVIIALFGCLVPNLAYAEDEAKEDAAEEESDDDVLKCDKDFHLIGLIDGEQTEVIHEKLIPCLQRDEPQTLILDSVGGESWATFGVYDRIKAMGKAHLLTVEVYGKAASAAVVMMLAADIRKISCHSFVLVHETKSMLGGPTAGDELHSMGLRNETSTEYYVEIIADRTPHSVDEVKALVNPERVIFAEEALKLGFATEIIGCE